MPFSRYHVAELDKVAAWLEGQGVVAAEDTIVRCVKEVVKKTKWNLDERRSHVEDFPAYFAKVLKAGGSTSAPDKGASKAEKDAAVIRAWTTDEKRWSHICLDLPDRGDGNIIRACRQLEAEGKDVTTAAVAQLTPSLLPPTTEEPGDPERRFSLKRNEQEPKAQPKLIGDALEERAA